MKQVRAVRYEVCEVSKTSEVIGKGSVRDE